MDDDSMNTVETISNNDASATNDDTTKNVLNDESSINIAEVEDSENIDNIEDDNVVDDIENEIVDRDDSAPALENNSLQNNNQRLTRLPLARVKNIMKFDDDVHAASQESAFLITKATELFIEDFMKEVYQCTVESKKKTVSKRDIDTAIFRRDYFIFLDGALD